MELKDNQSAIILEADESGEITLEVASSDHEGMTAKLCELLLNINTTFSANVGKL